MDVFLLMLLSCRKRSLTNDIMSENPSKKIKLEFQNKNDVNVGNDDVWGQDDDITAEEFDMLEIQATQACNQNCSVLNDTLKTNNVLPKPSNSVEVYDLKQHQYELEGRVKLLSLSLEKTSKELNEERLNREQIVNERMKQFQEREVQLKKEVEKMQSILEFKEQEMKSTHSKLQMYKSQLQDKKSISADATVNSNFDGFSKSSKSNYQSVRCDKTFPNKCDRTYKLYVDTPRGNVNGVEILSSILCTRLNDPFDVNKESIVNSGCATDSSFSSSITPVSVLHLKNKQNCDEILEPYYNVLKNRVNMLKTLASKNNHLTSNKAFQGSAKPKEACPQTVVSYLSDIIYIYSSPSFNFCYQKCNTSQENPSTSTHIQKTEGVSSCDHQKEKMIVSDSTLSLLQPLLALSKPETYPKGYYKNEEMEFALSALLSICLSCPKDFLDLIGDFPCYFLSNPHQSVSGLCTTLKLLIALCPNNSFLSYLAHKDSNCIFCLIADFLQVAVLVDLEKFATSLILVEEFLSSVLSLHNYKETELEASSCISKVIQSMIKSLWKYFQVKEENILRFEILKKGFLLLHFISSCIPNFKEKRNPVEDEYISLISGILTMSKENCGLREFYDLIHNLWDFQTDTSEFDLDDLSEETHACTNDIDVE